MTDHCCEPHARDAGHTLRCLLDGAHLRPVKSETDAEENPK